MENLYYRCKKDLFMDELCGGEKVFTKGDVYLCSRIIKDEFCVILVDDDLFEHRVHDDRWLKYFERYL